MNATLDKLNIATLIVLALVVLGIVQVLSNDLTYEQLLDYAGVPVGGLAIGRGIAAVK